MAPPLPSCLVLLALVASCPAQVLQYGDRAPDSTQAVGDPGMLVLFDTGEDGRWLNAVEAHVSPSGGQAADDEFEMYVIDLDGQLLRRVRLPYTLPMHGENGWCRLPIPPMVVPREFGIALLAEGDGSAKGMLEIEWGINFALRDLRQMRWGGGGGLAVGVYNVKGSHSYRWSPGTPGDGLWGKDWMVRAYVGNTADGDPEATDLVVLNSGEGFLDRVLSAEGDPLEVRTAGHGAIPRDDIASIRTRAVSSPADETAAVHLTNGTAVEGTIESMDDTTVSVREGDRLTTVARIDVARIDFTSFEAVPIAPQVEPRVSDTRRAWGPEQLTGPRDTLNGGDQQTAWASMAQDGGEEWLLLGYDNAVDVAEVRIWETYNPGAVSKVTAVLDDDTEVTLWEGEDPTTATPGEFVVTVEAQVQAKRVKVYLDSANHPGWNEIDAVELVGKDATRQWASTAGASSSYADR